MQCRVLVLIGWKELGLGRLPVHDAATSSVGLSVVEISGSLRTHASLQKLTTLHDSPKLKVLILGVDANTNNADGIPRLGHLLLLRIVLVLSSSGVGFLLLVVRQLDLFCLLTQGFIISLLSLLLSFSGLLGLGLGKSLLLHLLSLSLDLGVELLVQTSLLSFPLSATTLSLLRVLLGLLLGDISVGSTLLPHSASLLLTASRGLLLILLHAQLGDLIHVIPSLAVSKIVGVTNLSKLLILDSLSSLALNNLLNGLSV
ncbi:hypothetical protein HG531_011223 [Fusarium graminearum]|nr:hypothetical protein HG531_011223 [Fusarium graminearum]